MKSLAISDSLLQRIKDDAVGLGFPRSIRNNLELPHFEETSLKDLALAYFVSDAVTVNDPYFVVKCWLRAFETVLGQSGKPTEFVYTP